MNENVISSEAEKSIRVGLSVKSVAKLYISVSSVSSVLSVVNFSDFFVIVSI